MHLFNAFTIIFKLCLKISRKGGGLHEKKKADTAVCFISSSAHCVIYFVTENIPIQRRRIIHISSDYYYTDFRYNITDYKNQTEHVQILQPYRTQT